MGTLKKQHIKKIMQEPLLNRLFSCILGYQGCQKVTRTVTFSRHKYMIPWKCKIRYVLRSTYDTARIHEGFKIWCLIYDTTGSRLLSCKSQIAKTVSYCMLLNYGARITAFDLLPKFSLPLPRRHHSGVIRWISKISKNGTIFERPAGTRNASQLCITEVITLRTAP